MYWLNRQMLAKKERVGRNREKNETVFGWWGRNADTLNLSAIQGSKLNLEHSVNVQLNSVRRSIFLSLWQPLAITTCNHYSWSLHLGFRFLSPLTTMTVNSPYITNPGNSFSFNLKKGTPPAWMQLVYPPSPSNRQSALFIGLQIRWWF